MGIVPLDETRVHRRRSDDDDDDDDAQFPKNVPPQELLSHSTDRPERQQLKEALEAMQVCGLRGGRAPEGVRRR